MVCESEKIEKEKKRIYKSKTSGGLGDTVGERL